jgi:hypothetical protein
MPINEQFLKTVRAEVEKWQEKLRVSAEGKNEEYQRCINEGIHTSNVLMDQITVVNENWLRVALSLSLQAICMGPEFTKTINGLMTATIQKKQVMVFDSADQMAQLLGKAGGRG